ncbi:MAG: helix-turn-helix domain-containing protein [Candidatus Omnitrophota bacterium]
MITILIAHNEKKLDNLVWHLLQEGGYSLLQGPEDNRIINSVSIEESIAEIEKSLNNQKKGVLYKSILEKIEKPIFERILERTYGNQLKAARILGINRNTMRAKIKKLGINPELYKE